MWSQPPTTQPQVKISRPGAATCPFGVARLTRPAYSDLAKIIRFRVFGQNKKKGLTGLPEPHGQGTVTGVAGITTVPVTPAGPIPGPP